MIVASPESVSISINPIAIRTAKTLVLAVRSAIGCRQNDAFSGEGTFRADKSSKGLLSREVNR